MIVLIIYLLIMNMAGIIICGIDKKRAVRHWWRIPERQIFLIAVLGGSVGVLIGMYCFRHKTKHRQFTIGIPLILLCQMMLVMIIIRFL